MLPSFPLLSRSLCALLVACLGCAWPLKSGAQTATPPLNAQYPTSNQGTENREPGTVPIQNPKSKIQNPNVPSPEQQELDRLNTEGIKAARKADFPTALKTFEAGLEKAEALKDERRAAHFLSNIGIVYKHLGQFEKALDYHLKALAQFEKQGNSQEIAASLNSLGVVYYSLGQFSKALDYYQRALALDEKRGNPRDIASRLDNIGVIYLNLGQFEKALNYHQRALVQFEKLGDPQDIALNLLNMGNVYKQLGQFAKALDYFQRSLSLFEKLGNPQDIAYSLDNIGNIYDAQKQFAKALDYHQRALALFEKLGNPREIATGLNNLGSAYTHLGQFAKALDCHERALTLLEKLGHEQAIADCLNNIGTVYSRRGQFEKALDYYRKMLVLEEKIGNEQNIALCLNNIGIIYAEQQRWPQAEDTYRRALTYFEKVGQQVGEASEVGAFQETTNNLYARYAEALWQQKQPDKALEMLERGQGQGLSRKVKHVGVTLSALLAPQEVTELQQQEVKLSQASRRLQALASRNVPADREAQQQLAQEWKEAKEQRDKAAHDLTLFRVGLFARHPEYAERQGQPPALSQLVQLSTDHPGSLYLEYAPLSDKSTLLLTLLNGAVTPYLLPIGEKPLQELVTDWRKALLNQAQEEPQAARKVYAAVFPSGLFSTEVKRLVVVANGPLLDIPFTALVDGQGKRLVERFPVASVFSLGSLLWHDLPSGNREQRTAEGEKGRRGEGENPITQLPNHPTTQLPNTQRPTPNTLLCVADTTGVGGERVVSAMRGGFGALPFARQEGQSVSQLRPGALLLTGKKGTEAEVKAKMGRYRLLHFAVHGALDTKEGMRSALVLAKEDPQNGKEGQEDGFLEAREVAEMRLTARLAVLSACETAQGQKSGGEGLLGLAWAFRAAGCPAIVASQWKVEDAATGKLMVAFYKALLTGKRKDEALRQAMLLVKKEQPQPYYWAAFQVTGDANALPVSLIRK